MPCTALVSTVLTRSLEVKVRSMCLEVFGFSLKCTGGLDPRSKHLVNTSNLAQKVEIAVALCRFTCIQYIHVSIYTRIHTCIHGRQSMEFTLSCPQCNMELLTSRVHDNGPETIQVPPSHSSTQSPSYSHHESFSRPVGQAAGSKPARQLAIWAASQAIRRDALAALDVHLRESELCMESWSRGPQCKDQDLGFRI